MQLLLVNPHVLIGDTLSYILCKDNRFKCVSCGTETKQILDIIKIKRPGIIIIGPYQPSSEVLSIVKAVRGARYSIHILILCGNNNRHFIQRSLKAGANGVFTLDRSITELINAIYHIVDHGHYLGPSLAEELVFSSFSQTTQDNKHELLSEREYQIFLHLGQGQTLREISNHLNLSISTVASYKKRIFEKMNFKKIFDLIKYVITHGLIDS